MNWSRECDRKKGEVNPEHVRYGFQDVWSSLTISWSAAMDDAQIPGD